MKICNSCTAQNDDAFTFCKQCGNTLNSAPESISPAYPAAAGMGQAAAKSKQAAADPAAMQRIQSSAKKLLSSEIPVFIIVLQVVTILAALLNIINAFFNWIKLSIDNRYSIPFPTDVFGITFGIIAACIVAASLLLIYRQARGENDMKLTGLKLLRIYRAVLTVGSVLVLIIGFITLIVLSVMEKDLDNTLFKLLRFFNVYSSTVNEILSWSAPLVILVFIAVMLANIVFYAINTLAIHTAVKSLTTGSTKGSIILMVFGIISVANGAITLLATLPDFVQIYSAINYVMIFSSLASAGSSILLGLLCIKAKKELDIISGKRAAAGDRVQDPKN